MNNDTQLPEGRNLRALLREAQPAPPLPPRFRESVWRRIEHAEGAAAAPSSMLAAFQSLSERFLVPRFALASLAVLLVAGGVSGFVTSAGTARQRAQERYLLAVAPSNLP
jgi:hypothetical protein